MTACRQGVAFFYRGIVIQHATLLRLCIVVRFKIFHARMRWVAVQRAIVRDEFVIIGEDLQHFRIGRVSPVHTKLPGTRRP